MKKPDYSLFLNYLLGSFLLVPAIIQAQESVEDAGISLETCELVVPGTPLSAMAECGWLEVAENPTEPEGRKISIRVARVPATGRTSEPDPLIFFAGGPGQAATETWPIVAGGLRKLNETRDILLIDQRGTGRELPAGNALVQGELERCSDNDDPEEGLSELGSCEHGGEKVTGAGSRSAGTPTCTVVVPFFT